MFQQLTHCPSLTVKIIFITTKIDHFGCSCAGRGRIKISERAGHKSSSGTVSQHLSDAPGIDRCMIKIFRRAGVVTPPNPVPPTNNFCIYPPPVFRCFWKDPLMTPHHPTSSILHCYPLPIHHPSPPLKILIVHQSHKSAGSIFDLQNNSALSHQRSAQ